MERAILYSYRAVTTEQAAHIRETATLAGFEIVDYSIPTIPKDAAPEAVAKLVNPVKLEEVVSLAVQTNVTTVLALDPDSLPQRPERLQKLLIAPLLKAGKRLRTLTEPKFDTADPSFLYGFNWALDTRAHRISERVKDWHAEQKEAGVHTGRRKARDPKCGNCFHPVVKPGRPGHVRIGGVIGICYKSGCGCGRYVPSSAVLLGDAPVKP